MTVAYSGAERGSPGAKRRGVLDSLPTRQRTTGEQAAARSVVIRRLRIALPILAVVLIAALFLNTRTDVADDAFLEDFANLDARPEELKSTNPRFAGVDDRGYPYEITADTALQAPGELNVAELVEPRALTTGSKDATTVSAKRGNFQIEAKILELHDGVTLEHKIGDETYKLHTETAVITISDQTIHTTGAVEGEGAAGTLRADSMRAVNTEGRLVFEGNVSMRIYPEKAKAIEKPPEGEDGGRL
ncbi:MAG: LPS export ABC transporter periplasmic protein LptC [Parvularculaceae bacterium]